MNALMDRLKKLDTGLSVRIVVLIVLIIVLSTINKNFLSAYNISTLLETIALLMVMSIGMTFVLILGSIDLSIGGVISCGSVIMARLFPVIGGWAYPAILGFGLLTGFLNGLIFTKLKIPSFITTLATMSVYASLSLVISGATPLQIDTALKPMTAWVNIKFGTIPLVFILVCLVVAVFWVVQNKTKLGKYCFAVGANERAARMAGVRVDRTKIIIFTLAGLCFTLGTIIVTTKLMSGIPTVGNSYTLLVIAAVALGGTSLAGGKGGVLLTLLGATLSVVITNGMVVAGVDVYWQQIVYGVIIIVSLATSVDRSKTNLIVK